MSTASSAKKLRTVEMATTVRSAASAVSVAFAHLLFNVIGIACIWPIPAIRRLPILAAQRFADLAVTARWIPLAYIVVFFYLIPFLVIATLR